MNSTNVAKSSSLIRRLLELVRFSHTVFALPFALLGFVLACIAPTSATAQATAWTVLVRLTGIVLCMVSARSAAMAFNRLVDAQIDARNPRTAGRHLPTGELAKWQVWVFFALMVIAFELACVVFLPNWLPIAFSLPLLIWICSYSFAKRFTEAAHLWLGSSLALSPICAWIALRGEEVLARPWDVLPSIWLGVAIALWVSGFDIIYACQDVEFDRGHKLHSVPARTGVARALKLAALAHVLMLIVLAPFPLMFPQLGLGVLYWLAWATVAMLVVIQHRSVRADDLSRVNFAFFNVNAALSLGFCTVVALDAWIS